MTIYRNNTNGLMYTIEHVIRDWKFLDHNGGAGIRAYRYPIQFSGTDIHYYSQCKEVCMNFIDNNFKIVGNR